MDNQYIAQRLLNYANRLDAGGSNLYRRRAYRRAAAEIMRLDQPVERILEEAGPKALQALPGIGSHLAYTIEGLVRTGQFRTLTAGDGTSERTPILLN